QERQIPVSLLGTEFLSSSIMPNDFSQLEIFPSSCPVTRGQSLQARLAKTHCMVCRPKASGDGMGGARALRPSAGAW
ncbi:MAG: hypothetical protein MI749_03125, partial [Desulfovibrionales bacterium]|nr:hypothetical protein [Desulfovibrionales bacterium]